jgi:hypothetical protein
MTKYAYVEHIHGHGLERENRVTVCTVEKLSPKRITVTGFGTFDRVTGFPTKGGRYIPVRVLGYEEGTIPYVTQAGHDYKAAQNRPLTF